MTKNWDAQICAGEILGGEDTCQGDSGGSLYAKQVLNGEEKYVSVGIVSYGDGCAVAGYPG
jgi:secreted trypsin-like serine protease